MLCRIRKGKIKLSLPLYLHAMPSCCSNNMYLYVTWEPYSPQLCMELKEGGGVWIVSFSEVTPFEESVSTILSLIEAKKHGLVSNKNVQANREGSTV